MSPILGIWASQISGHLYTPVGSYDALATVTVPSGGAASITFAGIPTGYRHLQIRGISRFATNGSIDIRFNGDSSTNYSSHRIYGNGSTVNVEAAANTNQCTLGYILSSSTSYNGSVMDILDYANTSKYKTVRSLNGLDLNGSGLMLFDSSAWRSTDAISSIYIYSKDGRTFDQYSQFALYGCK